MNDEPMETPPETMKSSREESVEEMRKRREKLPVRNFLNVDKLKRKFAELTPEEWAEHCRKVEDSEKSWKPAEDSEANSKLI